jgi:uncharacterized membrane protein
VYELAKYIHILGAMIWVGGAIYAQLLSIRVLRSPDPADVPKLGRNLEFIGLRLFLPASLILFAAGVYMTIQRWSFQQLWISLAIVLWLLSVLAGALYIGPRTKRVAELFEAEGPTSRAARALLERLFLVSRLELVSFAVIVALMVFKPGIGGG